MRGLRLPAVGIQAISDMKRKVTKLERVLRKMKARELEYLLRHGARFNLEGGYTITIRD